MSDEDFFEWEEVEKLFGKKFTKEEKEKIIEEAEKYEEYRKAVEEVKVPEKLGQWTPEVFKKLAISTLEEILTDWSTEYEQQLFGKLLSVYEKNSAITAMFQGTVQFLATIIIFLIQIKAPKTEGIRIQAFVNSYYEQVADILHALRKKAGMPERKPSHYHGFLKKIAAISLKKAAKQKF